MESLLVELEEIANSCSTKSDELSNAGDLEGSLLELKKKQLLMNQLNGLKDAKDRSAGLGEDEVASQKNLISKTLKLQAADLPENWQEEVIDFEMNHVANDILQSMNNAAAESNYEDWYRLQDDDDE